MGNIGLALLLTLYTPSYYCCSIHSQLGSVTTAVHPSLLESTLQSLLFRITCEYGLSFRKWFSLPPWIMYNVYHGRTLTSATYIIQALQRGKYPFTEIGTTVENLCSWYTYVCFWFQSTERSCLLLVMKAWMMLNMRRFQWRQQPQEQLGLQPTLHWLRTRLIAYQVREI